MIYFSIFILVFAFISISVGSIVSDFLISERTGVQSSYNQQTAIMISPYVSGNDAKMLYSLSQDRTKNQGGRVLIVSPNEIVLSDSFSERNGTKMSTKEVRRVISGEKDQAYAFYESTDNQGARSHSVNYASGIYQNGALVGVSVYITSFNDIRSKVSEIYLIIFTIAFIASVGVFLLCLATARYITQPLTYFSQAIQSVSAGNFDTKLEEAGSTELRQLAKSFNLMSQKLQNLDRLRNEFVSNASHELRTPLSSMKILLENMIYEPDMPPELRQEFFQDIVGEIDRLNSIIEDLLMLVQTNSTKGVLRLSQENIGDMLQTIIQKLEPLARQKNIRIELDAPEQLISGVDKIKLQICFSNLVDNAIKYGNDGGRVAVALQRFGGNWRVSIQDDGIGMPSPDLPNIFDRFYRVDKTRSRATGGTGLGLSITQRIILLHGGTIEVDSHLGEGTTFAITIPIVD